MQAEKKIDVTPIKLPYDSLILKDIYAFNSTLLVRSGNTIYKSSDNGDNWKIAFESEKKINQLYSQDPHTIFVVGDSGMVFRTFDYGDSWIDISYPTLHNFTAIAAKSFEDYLIVTERTHIYKKDGIRSEIRAIESYSIIPLYSVVYYDTNYIFSGGFYRRNYYASNAYRTEFLLPYYLYDGKKIKYEIAEQETSTTEQIGKYQTDSLNFFYSENGLFFNVVNNNQGGIILDRAVDLIFDVGGRGVVLRNDRIMFVDNPDENIYLFSREGYWATYNVSYYINNGISKNMYLDDLEHQHLGMTPINSVYKRDSNSYYISSNNSTIYRADFSDVISRVEDKSSNYIKINGSVISFDLDVDSFLVYNYMGIPVSFTKLSDSRYRLSHGLNFVTYSVDEKTTTIKVVVME